MMLTRALAIALAFSPVAATAQDGWTTHTNDRFGTRLEYPAQLFDRATAVESGSGDGTTFGPNADGAKLLVWGSHNALNQMPYQNICSNGCRGESFAVRDRFTGISSGTVHGRIYYSRCKMEQDARIFRCFRIEYPEARRAIYDPVTARISRSLN